MEASILVIDNDKSMRDLFTVCLIRAGWQVFSYPYAQINLAALEQYGPDLIILDFDLQNGGKAWEFLQLLKMDDTTARIPIMITTTASHLSAEVRGYLLTRYISVVHKPFDLKTFVALVQKTLTQASQAGDIFSGDRSLPILVVDDTKALRETITTVLGLEGYQVVNAENGLVALETVSRADHRLILLDIVMPIMNGYEFLSAYNRQLRPHSPVIIFSGEPDIETRVLPSFVVEVIPKPFEISHLLGLVEKFVQPV
jgi:DNA-binding response OmpR family regulator